MEFLFPSFQMLTLIISSIIFLFIIFKFKRATTNKPERDLDRIPGPRRLPVIGNLHLLLSKSMPHIIFRKLAGEYGPLLRLQLGAVPFLIVSSVDVAKQILKTHDVAFANRPPMHVAKTISYNYTGLAMAPYGEYWRYLRKICTLELLSSKRVRFSRSIREEENLNLAAAVAASKEGSPVNLSEIVELSAYDITYRSVVGEAAAAEKEAMAAAIGQAAALGSGLSIPDLYPSSKVLPFITGMVYRRRKVFGVTDRVIESIVRRRRATGPPSDERSEALVDFLLRCQQDDAEVRLTTDNVKAVILVRTR